MLNQASIISYLHTCYPDVQAIYLFGSQANGEARADSDIDLAILVDAPMLNRLQLWENAQALAVQLGQDVDLLDLRQASTVMQSQIVQHGQRIWSQGQAAEVYEVFILNQKLHLDELRHDMLRDIQYKGHIYAR